VRVAVAATGIQLPGGGQILFPGHRLVALYLAIVVHMDGQGTQGMKQETWNAVTAAAPRGMFFGWKNFFVKDHPLASPQNTMSKQPQPVMISYQ
jgi:hypothetical protein